ncbi:unnamed protein product, partial [Rotaria sp. Silwood1]
EDQRSRQAASRVARWTDLEGEAFRYNPVKNYDKYPQFNIGRMDNVRSYCGALKWSGEAPGMCCSNDKVSLPPLQPPPELLQSLMSGTTHRSKHFLETSESTTPAFR